jgi:predicted nucleic-acid-binding protein
MIGVDTNVLLRLIVDDEPQQNAAAKKFFAARSVNDPAYIGLVAVAEFSWLLRKRYGYSKDQIADTVLELLDSVDLVIERPDLIEQAAILSRQPKVDFADVLISRLAEERGCSSTMTFDRDAAKRVPGMALLT